MKASEKIFIKWMQQAGIVKKLQAALTLSLIFNIFLGQQLIISKIAPKEVKEQIEATEEQALKITESELREFILKYLDSFFSIELEAENFIKSNSENGFYLSNIKPEITKRRDLKLESEFKLGDIFLESLDPKTAKAIVLGQEIFTNGEYQNRDFTIELLVDTEIKKIIAIPVFKVKS